MARFCAQPWEVALRREVRAFHGRGMTLGPHRGGRAQFSVRWSDGSRSAATSTLLWRPQFHADLVAVASLVSQGVWQGVRPAVVLAEVDLLAEHAAPSGEDPAYGCWRAMLDRCHNPRSSSWPRYGGAGVMVDPRWRRDFQVFRFHIGPRPSPAHSIDRIDPEGHYVPGNVRWATPVVQARNTRRAKAAGGAAAEVEILRAQAAELLAAAERAQDSRGLLN